MFVLLNDLHPRPDKSLERTGSYGAKVEKALFMSV